MGRMEGFQLILVNGRNSLRVADSGVGIGVRPVEGSVECLGRHLSGILVLDRDTSQNLVPNPLKLFFGESRLLGCLNQ